MLKEKGENACTLSVAYFANYSFIMKFNAYIDKDEKSQRSAWNRWKKVYKIADNVFCNYAYLCMQNSMNLFLRILAIIFTLVKSTGNTFLLFYYLIF